MHLRVLDRIQRLGDLTEDLDNLKLRITSVAALGDLILLLLLLLWLRVAIRDRSRRIMWNLLGVLHLLLLLLRLHRLLLLLGQLADCADEVLDRLLLLGGLPRVSLSSGLKVLSLDRVLRGCLGLSLRLIDASLDNLS